MLLLVGMAPLAAAQSATPTQTVTFSRTISFGAVTVTVSSSFTVDTTAQTLSGSTSVKVVNISTGQVIVSKNFTIALAFGTSNSISLDVAVPSVPLMVDINCAVSTGSTPAAACNVSAQNIEGPITVPLHAPLAFE